MEKETKYSDEKISFKEDDKGEFYSEGFVATTHPDRVNDVLTKKAIEKIVDSINNRTLKPQAGAASDRHDNIKQNDNDLPLAGRAISAETRIMDHGHFGAFIKTHHHKHHPKFEEIKYDVEKGYYPGYSIEYTSHDTGTTMIGDKEYRLLDAENIELEGYGFASLRNIANPKAEITDYGYKEIANIEKQEENKMTEKKEDIVEEKPVKEEASAEEKATEEESSEESSEEKSEEKEVKEVETKEVSGKEHTVSEEDFKRITQLKELEEREIKEKEIKEAVKKELKEILPKGSPLLNTEDTEPQPEMKEISSYKKTIKEYKEAMNKTYGKKDDGVRAAEHKKYVDQQWTDAKELLRAVTEKGVDVFSNNSGISLKEQPIKSVGSRMEIKELGRIEVKAGEGLQVDTNLADSSWTYGSYYLSPVELNDIFQPVLINQLNDQFTTFGKLEIVDFSGRSQIQFRARTGRNSTAGGYSEGQNLTYGAGSNSFPGAVGRDKFQQPFSYYRVLVAVTGQEMALARAPGGIGDVWADELKWSSIDLMRTLNLAIIGTGDGTSESTALGFEGLILGTTGNLYGKNIATYTTLKSFKENMSSDRITLNQLRKMIRLVGGGDSTVTGSNARVPDLVFFCHPLQRDFIKDILQDMQRLIPTSGRVGFEGEIEVDGVPIFGDVLMNTDDLFLIDMSHTKIGVNVPPTVEPLPVTADARAAQVKTYFNLFSDAPSNNYWAHTLATS